MAELQQLKAQQAQLQNELAKLKDLNKRGDTAYQQLSAELKRSQGLLAVAKDAKAVAALTEEKDAYEAQLRGLQTILRSTTEELEKYKKLVEQSGQTNANDTTSGGNQRQLQERIDALKAEAKGCEAKLAELLKPAATTAVADGETQPAEPAPPTEEQLAAIEQARATLASARTALTAAEEEVADSASAAVKATRAREKIEREQKDKLNTLESALAFKIAEAAELAEAKSGVEDAYARDMDQMLQKLQERDLDLSTLRARAKESADTLTDSAAQLAEVIKQRDDESKKREAEAKSRDDAVSKAIKEKEDEFKKTLKDRDDEIKRLTKDRDEEVRKATKEAEAELKKATKDAQDELKKVTKEKDEEIKKLAAAAKDAVASKEAALATADLQRKLDAAQSAVTQLTEATAELQREKDDAISDARSLREKVIKRENKLTIVTQERADAVSQLAELSSEVKSLSKKLEKQRAATKTLEGQLKESKNECEKLGLEVKRAADVRSKLDAELAATKASLSDSQAMANSALSQLDEATAELELRGDAMSRLEEAVAAAQSRVEELRAEHAVASRVVKTVNRELKAQLSAETRKVAKLERELGQAQKAMLNAVKAGVGAGVLPPSSPSLASFAGNPNPNLHRGPTLSTMSLPGTASLNTPPGVASAGSAAFDNNPFGVPSGAPRPSGGGSQGTLQRGATAGAYRPAGPSAMAAGNAKRASEVGVAAMGGGNMEETVKLLGSRLKDVLAEAEMAKEKVRMLEGIVQSLSGELDEKRRLLKELTSSGSPGSSNAGGAAVDADIDAEAAAAAAVSGPPEAAMPVLQSRLAKSLAETARLKRDMRTIGAEVLAAQDRARESDRKADEIGQLLAQLEAADQQAQALAFLGAAQAAGAEGTDGRGSVVSRDDGSDLT